MTHRVAIVLNIVCDNSPVMLLEKGNGMTHIVFNYVPKSVRNDPLSIALCVTILKICS